MEFNIYEVTYDYGFDGQRRLIIGEESLTKVGEFLVTKLGEEFIPGFRVNSYRDTGFKTNRRGIISPPDFIVNIRNRKRTIEHLMKYGSPASRAYAAGPDSPEWREAMKDFWDLFRPKDPKKKEEPLEITTTENTTKLQTQQPLLLKP
jgi:hypothetical protein